MAYRRALVRVVRPSVWAEETEPVAGVFQRDWEGADPEAGEARGWAAFVHWTNRPAYRLRPVRVYTG